MVIDPTYFTKDASASLNDVILTNRPSYWFSYLVVVLSNVLE
jgi:hypothetical protein